MSSKKEKINNMITIENIVGSGNLPVEIDVQQFAEGMEEEYGYTYYDNKDKAQDAPDEEKEDGFTWESGGAQPGLYYEVEGDDGPQVTFHESGSYIVRADSESELYETNERVIDELKSLGVIDEELDIESLNFEIQNVVALVKLDEEIRLRALSIGLGADAQYEPEVFPALDYSRPGLNCNFLVYGNGKVIIAGAKSIDDVQDYMYEFYDEMTEWIELELADA